ncbi:O-methyltransferase, partial [Trifolium pratense]
MTALLLLESSPVMVAPWLSLSGRVLVNGNPSFEKVHGEDVWRYAASNLDHSNLINDAMACDAKVVVPAIVEGCGEIFDGVESLVDVGGGNGTTMSILAKAFPWIHGINFDLPHVIDVAPKCDGVEHVAGDMFMSVPKADAVIIK